MPESSTLAARIGSLEAGHEYLRRSVDRIEPKIDRLTETAHETAVTLERVAARLDEGAREMKETGESVDDHGERIESLETTRTRQGAYITAAGFAGAALLWFAEHAVKALVAIVK